MPGQVILSGLFTEESSMAIKAVLENADLNIGDSAGITEEEREERRKILLANEDDMITNILRENTPEEETRAEITVPRGGKPYIIFTVHSLSSRMLDDIRRKYTKYEKSKNRGVRVANDVDSPSYRASLIYNSTIDEDKRKLWDNDRLKQGLTRQGKSIINALDVINTVLRPGEIDYIISILDQVNGFDTDEITATGDIDLSKN